jgi:flagellar hook assembly protein FlgD
MGLSVDIRLSGRRISCKTSRLVVGKSGTVKDAAVYDISGKVVRRIPVSYSSCGASVEWNGLTDRGSVVSRGLYVLTIRSESAAASCTIIAE